MGMRINEIFYSIQGESSSAGYPFIFIRLTGCNLRCSYCDSAYAFYQGEEFSVEEVLERVRVFGRHPVLITGGEPLLQPQVHDLMKALLDDGYQLLLETGGSLPLANVDPRVVKIMDIKCPSSGEADSSLWDNLSLLTTRDEIKFVIGDLDDYEYAKSVCLRYRLTEKHGVLFSPVHGVMAARELAEWILNDRLRVRLQLQLHKYLWPEKERGY
jgi:7-carboxy-7-deazaguanine synthase